MHPSQENTRPFDRTVLATLISGVALLALVLAIARGSILQLQLTSNQARATEEFRRQLDVVSETLLNMETGQRGYLLTVSDDYLEPYKTGQQRIAREISRLQELMTDNQVQRQNVAKLTALLEERLGQMEHALGLHRTQGAAAAMQFVKTNQGHATMAEVRELFQQMSAEEERILAERRAEERRSLQRNFWLSATLSALVAALMVVIYLLVHRETKVRAQAAEQLDRVNASLEARVRESTRHLSEANEALQAEIEQRKRAESELQRSHDLLEERVRERTAELVEASAARSRFLSAASHDLRQPLQSLMLLNATLRDQNLHPLAARIVETQQNSLESMTRLVHALLNINRLESGAVEPEISDFLLDGMLEELRSEFAPLAHSKGVALHVDAARIAVRSDPTLLREIVQNLLANAVRYTDQGEVRVRARETAGGVRIEVQDTGPGIPEEQHDLIFEEFQQLRPKAGMRGEGFGLGLAIVRHAARVLGVRIELSSQVGVGATFSLTVPLGAAEASASPQPENAASSGAFARVLLVDDEPSVRNATALFLGVTGHEVMTASSPDEALKILETSPTPDVVITDYQLGAPKNGAELIEAIRSRLGHIIPAVILTGDTTRLSRQCTSMEMCSIFHKPVDAQELAQHLQKIVLAAKRAPVSRQSDSPAKRPSDRASRDHLA